MGLRSAVTVTLFLASMAAAQDGARPPEKFATMRPVAGNGSRIIPERLDAAPFTFGDVPVVAAGPVAEGGVLVSGPLRYGYTAQLEAPFAVKTKFGVFRFASGDVFYGVPFLPPFKGGLRGISWCMPRVVNGKHWADCILAFEKWPVAASQTSENPYLVDNVLLSRDTTTEGPLRLVTGPNAVADSLTVQLRVRRWTERKAEFVSEVTSAGLVLSSVRSAVALKNGAGLLRFGRGVIGLRFAGGRGSAEILEPVAVGDSIVPRDGR